MNARGKIIHKVEVGSEHFAALITDNINCIFVDSNIEIVKSDLVYIYSLDSSGNKTDLMCTRLVKDNYISIVNGIKVKVVTLIKY